jgi:hypothetical protein
MTDEPEPSSQAPPDRRLLGLTLASGALGVLLMILFEAAITRVLGVTLLFTFVIAGVFLIADPAWVGDDDADA